MSNRRRRSKVSNSRVIEGLSKEGARISKLPDYLDADALDDMYSELYYAKLEIKFSPLGSAEFLLDSPLVSIKNGQVELVSYSRKDGSPVMIKCSDELLMRTYILEVTSDRAKMILDDYTFETFRG